MITSGIESYFAITFNPGLVSLGGTGRDDISKQPKLYDLAHRRQCASIFYPKNEISNQN